MSLLLDARKKSQEGSANRPESGLSLEPVAADSRSNPVRDGARSASQNLFLAKSAIPSGGHVNRNLLYALLGSIVLFCLGAVYVWYEINTMGRPVAVRPALPPSAAITPPPTPVVAATQPLVSDIAPVPLADERHTAQPVHDKALLPVRDKPHSTPHIRNSTPAITVLREPGDDLDTQLNNAYRAYQAGKFEQALTLYRGVLAREPSNVDALLGQAAIAQQTGSDTVARQYYARVLVLEPRNAVANAGMSALVKDEDKESRLKMLIDEQRNASSLHSALANYYAAQQRWAEAQQSYFNAYQLEPNNATLAYNLAISLERLGQRRPAAQYYRRALTLDTGKRAGFDHAVIARHAQALTE